MNVYRVKLSGHHPSRGHVDITCFTVSEKEREESEVLAITALKLDLSGLSGVGGNVERIREDTVFLLSCRDEKGDSLLTVDPEL